MPLISVVTSVYNDAVCLPEFRRRVVKALADLTGDFEVILVDDGSSDDSWQVISELAASDKRVRGILLSRNFGQHYGLTAGLDHCDGDWVVVMDCDLQDRPEEIARLYDKAREGFDVVLARRGPRKDGALKRLASWTFYRVFNYFTGMKYDGRVGNFRIMSRQVVENFRNVREQLRFVGGIVDWMGFRQGAVEVEHAERHGGKTSYNFRRLWRLAQEIIIAYSDKPLRLAVRFGFAISALAFVYGIYIVYRSLAHKVTLLGWSSLIVSLYFLAGIMISIMGIIGIYLGRTFAEAKKRPLYVVRSRVNVQP